jgi:antitoxin HicB
MVTKKILKVKAPKTFQVIRSGIVFEFQSEPEGGYTISVPSLPGCISYGSTFEEAIEKIKDAMAGWLAVAKEEGLPIPEQFVAIKLAGI